MTASIVLETGGETVAINSELAWVSRLLHDCADGAVSSQPGKITLAIHVEETSQAFEVSGLAPLARKAWSGSKEIVIADACSSGFDVRLNVGGAHPEFTYRWRPGFGRSVARFLLPARFLLLAREVLLHYPVLWWSSIRGRVPLHAVACTVGERVVLLAGPGGVGKSTLLRLELAGGGHATSDNLCVADGESVWGLVEPMRVDGDHGRRTSHRRVEVSLEGRVPRLSPDHVVVVRRGNGDTAKLVRCDSETAARSLVTGTYMAGELSRFWGYAATLGAGTGMGPSHPAVTETASAFASRLDCFELCLPRWRGLRLADALQHAGATS